MPSRTYGVLWVALCLTGSALAICYNPSMTDEKARELAKQAQFAGAGTVRAAGYGGTGVLIAPQWVLTARHVIVSPAEKVSFDLKGKHYEAEAVFTNPKADLALIKLKSPIEKATCTPPYTGHDEKDKEIWKVGFGVWQQFGEKKLHPPDGHARAVTSTIHDLADNELFYKYHGGPPKGGEFDGGTAPGDSGGPMYLQEGDKWYVAGVTSGPRKGFYADARVGTHADWIAQCQAGKIPPSRPTAPPKKAPKPPEKPAAAGS